MRCPTIARHLEDSGYDKAKDVIAYDYDGLEAAAPRHAGDGRQGQSGAGDLTIGR